MHKIRLIVRYAQDVDVILFDERDIHLPEYSMSHMSAVRAYIFVRGLVALFSAGMSSESLTSWQYIEMLWRAQGSQN